jgi:putative ABC transport system permease protein
MCHSLLALVSAIRNVLEARDPALALSDPDRVDRIVARSILLFDVFGKLFLFFGMTALLLAAIGLYGVVSFSVRQRGREWGIRLALGARAADVVRLVMRRSGSQVFVGLAPGLALAGVLSTPLAAMFYKVEPWDPRVFGTVATVLATVCMAAAYLPARRAAAHIDPMLALRRE